ncbi:IS481 family transposase [Chondrinema litorale]|uniref:IS481 family transposase n=1 Tax=Chondrinema litorale TaxID=2994555 RepID=UPI002543B9B0|nr:IS481 family transposase [Chondrinema litorale]UZS00029.1 IS481 family transposase [Chondrinema litorale]
MTAKAHSDIRRKLKVLNYAKEIGNITKACRYFGISRETYYKWKRAYDQHGQEALINKKPCPENPKLRTPIRIEKLILHLRKTYHLGQLRIKWYLKRYHDIEISEGAVYYVLKRNGMNLLPKNQRKRSIKPFKRYEKKVPGHRIQIDVKFLNFTTKEGKKIRRYQYTAIDDATRARALKIYSKHTQANAIDFVNYILKRFPFRIHTVQTDNGHEFQVKFHWYCEDLGIRHVYIKPASPHLNGKVERSHSTDKQEFYQLIEYTDDIDIRKKLQEWETFYNCHRPHSALKGKTPYEVLMERLS